MSWAEVKKINSDLTKPLDELIKSELDAQMFFFSNVFIVPETGEYLITCIGKGGKGGGGSSGTSIRKPGGGGGGGGVSQSLLTLTKNDSIAITVTDSVSSFGSYLTAGAGGPGAQLTGGVGGTASGGNLLNAPGQNGETRVQYEGSGGYGGSVTALLGGSTGGGGGGGGGQGGQGANFFSQTWNLQAGNGGGTTGGFGGSTGGGGASGAQVLGGQGIFHGASGGSNPSAQVMGCGGGGGSFGGGGGGGTESNNSYGGPGATGAVIIQHRKSAAL